MKRVETVLGYKVIYETNELGGYCVSIPAFNGTVTQGDTLEHARFMARDAIEGWLEVLAKDKMPIPLPIQGVSNRPAVGRVTATP
jgi:predicted RNase H-like HicB family nuclease